MSLNEVPEPEKIYPPDVDIEDYFLAMGKIKPTVSEKDLLKQEEFTRDFGQEGKYIIFTFYRLERVKLNNKIIKIRKFYLLISLLFIKGIFI